MRAGSQQVAPTAGDPPACLTSPSRAAETSAPARDTRLSYWRLHVMVYGGERPCLHKQAVRHSSSGVECEVVGHAPVPGCMWWSLGSRREQQLAEVSNSSKSATAHGFQGVYVRHQPDRAYRLARVLPPMCSLPARWQEPRAPPMATPRARRGRAGRHGGAGADGGRLAGCRAGVHARARRRAAAADAAAGQARAAAAPCMRACVCVPTLAAAMCTAGEEQSAACWSVDESDKAHVPKSGTHTRGKPSVHLFQLTFTVTMRVHLGAAQLDYVHFSTRCASRASLLLQRRAERRVRGHHAAAGGGALRRRGRAGGAAAHAAAGLLARAKCAPGDCMSSIRQVTGAHAGVHGEQPSLYSAALGSGRQPRTRRTCTSRSVCEAEAASWGGTPAPGACSADDSAWRAAPAF